MDDPLKVSCSLKESNRISFFRFMRHDAGKIQVLTQRKTIIG